MTSRLTNYSVLLLGATIGILGFSSVAQAQSILPGTTALADWERQALLCRGQQSQLEALSAIGGISDNERRAIGLGTSPENDWCLFLSSSRHLQNEHSHVRGLNPGFGQCLTRFFQAAPGTLSIYSGYRDPYHQARLFNDALARYGSVEAADNWVAPPPCNDRDGSRIQYANSNQICRGGSMHNFGLAADLRFNGGTCGSSQALCDWAHAHAAAFGLTFRLGNEPWHIEPASRDGACATDGQVIPLEGQDSVALEVPTPTPRPFGEDGAGTQFLEDIGIRDPEDPNTPAQNIFGGLLDSIFGGVGTSSDAGEDQNESLGYSFGELLGTWFGDLFSGQGAQGQDEPDESEQQPDVTTVYYYETDTGTSTLYTVISVDKEVLATSTISASEAIEAATVGFDSYLVLHIDDPNQVPAANQGPNPSWGNSRRDSTPFDFGRQGSDNTFTGSFDRDSSENGTESGRVLDGDSTFGANGDEDRPFLRAVVDTIRDFFSNLFGVTP